MKTMRITGSSKIAYEAIQLFGSDRVTVGTWLDPVEVRELTDDEVEFAKEYFDQEMFAKPFGKPTVTVYGV